MFPFASKATSTSRRPNGNSPSSHLLKPSKFPENLPLFFKVTIQVGTSAVPRGCMRFRTSLPDFGRVHRGGSTADRAQQVCTQATPQQSVGKCSYLCMGLSHIISLICWGACEPYPSARAALYQLQRAHC